MAVDPGAVYQENLANLQLVENNENARIGEQEGNLKSNVGYAENEISRVEPGTYRSSSHAANKGGILNSGIQSRRTTDIANTFAAKRTANANRLGQTLPNGQLQKFQNAREGVGLKKTLGITGFAQQRAREEDALQAQNPTVPAPAAAPAAPATGVPWGNTGNQSVRIGNPNVPYLAPPPWGNTGNKNVRIGNPKVPYLRKR